MIEPPVVRSPRRLIRDDHAFLRTGSRVCGVLVLDALPAEIYPLRVSESGTIGVAPVLRPRTLNSTNTLRVPQRIITAEKAVGSTTRP
jgi:hypothetical protein